MRSLWRASLVAAMLAMIGVSTADACYCGVLRFPCCRPASCCPTACGQCCTVMKTCQETVYEEYEVTAYKTVYEEVIDKKTVPAVRYEEQTAYRYRKCAIAEPQPCEGCASCAAPQSCAPAESCGPAPCCAAPVECIRKVPYTALVPVEYEKVIERPRVVAKQVPYTIICCKPKVVYKQVPVRVCCPMPCCERPTCCASGGCG